MERRVSRRRLWPYYVYVSTVFTALVPSAAVVVPELIGRDHSADVFAATLVLTAAHLLVAAAVVVSDAGGAIDQLRAVARVQRRRWPWCRPIYAIYRDSALWWRISVTSTFLPCALVFVWLAVMTAR